MFFYRFSQIGELRQAVRTVMHTTQYIGKDVSGKPMYDPTIPLPTIEYIGRVKMHGTNSGVVCNLQTGEIGFISRERVLSIEEDNAFFAAFGYENIPAFKAIFDELKTSIDSDFKYAIIYGEWAGGKISSGSALANIERTFIAFRIRLFGETSEDNKLWVEDKVLVDVFSKFDFNRITYVHRFGEYRIKIDFNKPDWYKNALAEMTIAVEDSCPVALGLGVDPSVSNVGEGIVWAPTDPKWLSNTQTWFKVKGAKHSKSRVKTMKTIDMDMLQAMEELCDEVCPPWRIEQMAVAVFNLNNDGCVEKSGTTKLVRSVMDDIKKEQLDVIEEAGVELKAIGQAVYKRCLAYIHEATKPI